jgi:hypothetical protein
MLRARPFLPIALGAAAVMAAVTAMARRSTRSASELRRRRATFLLIVLVVVGFSQLPAEATRCGGSCHDCKTSCASERSMCVTQAASGLTTVVGDCTSGRTGRACRRLAREAFRGARVSCRDTAVACRSCCSRNGGSADCFTTTTLTLSSTSTTTSSSTTTILGGCSGLSETFDGGTLDPRISLQTVGTFDDPAGVHALADFGSANAFGFGLSTCGANCFFNYGNILHIAFPQPLAITTISFDEEELFDNWGSDGAILIDGVPIGTGFRDFGRLPYNDRHADTTVRSHVVDVNACTTDTCIAGDCVSTTITGCTPCPTGTNCKTATTVDLRVEDITNLSEIFVDNLAISAVGCR